MILCVKKKRPTCDERHIFEVWVVLVSFIHESLISSNPKLPGRVPIVSQSLFLLWLLHQLTYIAHDSIHP